ncbi:MAG: PAS domain-containing protein [Gammaproteobacteria bacterium]
MTSLLRQFMIISIVGMTLTLLTLIYFHIELSEEYLRQHLDSHNKNLSVVLRNSLLVEGLEEALVDNESVLSPAMTATINSNLEQELRWVPVVKVKIYGRDSTVLYSTRIEEIGASASGNEGVQQALAGAPVSGHVHPNHLNEFDNIIEVSDLHQQYIPIKSRQSGEVIGVFETYLNVYEVVKDVKASQRIMFWLIAGILALFYLALAFTFLRTHRLLQSESRQRQAHLSELNQIHMNLEQRVEERTAELAHAKNFLQSIIDGIANPILVIRPDFTIALMNRQAKSLIPADQKEENYKYCYQVSHRLNEPCSEPDHPCSFAEVMQEGSAARVRHTHYDADNKPIIVDLLTTPLYSAEGEFEGVIEVEHDVTQIVEMQAGLIESEARLQATIDHVPDAILTCDSNYSIVSTNQSAGRLFQSEESELIGRNLSEFFSNEEALTSFKAESAAQQQTILKRSNATEFPADVWIGPLESGDGGFSYIIVMRDVSSWIQAQHELDTSREQYFHQDKMVAIGQLAAGILHEVGNPIAAIAGAAAEFKQTFGGVGKDGDVNRNIELIDEQITRLGKITREIADFASPRPRERELLDLNGLLRSTTRLLTYDQRFSSIGVDLKLDKNLPAIVGVADQLTQVFMNLLINAMDACAGNEAGKDCIVLSSEFDGDSVNVCVQDFGTGMSKETLEHVMELFYTTKPVGKGSGMGLSLCDTIVRAHGGTLNIESEVGKGTRVYVVLPIDLIDQDSTKDKTVVAV